MPKRDYTPQYIRHFSHDHGYFFVRTSEIQVRIRCQACGELISSTAHGALYASCEMCQKFMHKSCAELPQVMTNHPFHPDHPLTLVDPKGHLCSDVCNACGHLLGFYFKYNCLASVHKFSLCVQCATLVQMTHGETVREHQLCHQKIPHPHPVILCTKPFGTTEYFFNFSCGFCGLPFEDKGDTSYICVCLECKLLLHISCADFPHEIRNHPFHFQHTLTIYGIQPISSHSREFECSACREDHTEALSFKCSQENCEFQLDALCASLIYENQNQNQITQHTVGDDVHPLIDCRISQQVYKFHTLCRVCNQPFKDSLCFCLSCHFFLHKSCAKLPDRINHPFHKQHPLLLSFLKYFRCNACLETYPSFAYECSHCEFRLCVRCSWSDLYPVIVDQYNHMEHPLSLFSFKPLGSTFNCGRCSHKISTPFLRCVSCDFNLHTHCLSRLPPTAKTNHLHTLNLTYLPIKDDEDVEDDEHEDKEDEDEEDEDEDEEDEEEDEEEEDEDEEERAEFYCDCCEERRNLLHPTYYCAECHYVAHVHCVITQEFIDYYVQKATISAEEISDTKMDTTTTKFLKSRTVLPLRINHRFHDHLLTLSDSLDFGQKKKYTCSVCIRKCHNLSYVCHPCEFYLDLSCVLSDPFEIESDLHEHSLEFFNCIPLPELYCDKCHQMIFTPFFRCLKCYFTLHGNCFAKSKHTVKNKIHWHPLTFTYFADGEFECIVCGTMGDLGDATHSCEICPLYYNIVAHSRCVLPDKAIPHLLEESAPEGIKKLTKHSAMVKELKEKTEELKKKMKEVKGSLAEIKVAAKEIGQSIADDEYLAELDELKDICAQFIASTTLSSKNTTT